MTSAAVARLFAQLLDWIPSSAYASLAKALAAALRGDENNASLHMRAVAARAKAKAIVRAKLRVPR